MTIDRAVVETTSAVQNGARRATKFISPSCTVKATRQHKPDGRKSSVTIILTIGRPNYSERAFIAACKKAGEPFPVRKVQLKEWK